MWNWMQFRPNTCLGKLPVRVWKRESTRVMFCPPHHDCDVFLQHSLTLHIHYANCGAAFPYMEILGSFAYPTDITWSIPSLPEVFELSPSCFCWCEHPFSVCFLQLEAGSAARLRSWLEAGRPNNSAIMMRTKLTPPSYTACFVESVSKGILCVTSSMHWFQNEAAADAGQKCIILMNYTLIIVEFCLKAI